MSIPSALPLSGKTDSTTAPAGTEDLEITASGNTAAAEFGAALVQIPDEAALPALGDLPEGEAKDTSDTLISPDDSLEAILQSWHGISAEIAEKNAVPDKPPADKRPLSTEADGQSLPVDLTATLRHGDRHGEGTDVGSPNEIIPEKPVTIPPAVTAAIFDDAPQPALRIEGNAVSVGSDLPAGPDTAPMRPAPTPAQVIRQISEAVVATKDNQIDIALSPEELGRIRMRISDREGVQHIVIWAERPEVLDQLRRNATTLLQEFFDAGMEDLSFEFKDDRPDQDDSDWRAAQMAEDIPDAPFIPPAPQAQGYTNLALGPRIDIRI